MRDEQTGREGGWQAAAAASLLDLLVLVARLRRETAHEPPVELSDRADRAVLDTVAHLEAHYDGAPRLADLARRVRISPGHLSRCFGQRMGMGVIDFVHRLRTEEACRLLRWTDAAVGEIASRVGYAEVAYFSRCFSKHMGQSPSEYRARYVESI
jgi:transcriptional regulator GlxA family with amidase domain